MSPKQRLLWTPVLVCLITAGTAFAAGPIADVSLDSSTLVFQPQIAQKGWTLTITGPDGFYFRQDFEGAAAPSWSAFDQAGLADGVYSYELVGIPAARALVEDRAAGVALERNVLSGSFTVRGGVMVDAGLPEEVPTKDQVILDDLIVDGSICVGQDCVNGESFGFDTLRLKENNLRIKFQDTSTSASFPTNDWQITINDSSNGGQNKFSIDDIDGGRIPFTIEAGAPSHSLYVDDGGRIGFGTSTPVVELHVKDGDTPTLRLEQDGSSGFTAQTWDLAGNETNIFIRDATNGSTLPFRIRPGAPTSSIDVAGNGEVGIGTTSPDRRLHVLTASGTSPGIKVEDTLGSGTTTLLELDNNGAVRIALEDTAGALTWQVDADATEFLINNNLNSTDDFRLSTNGDLFIAGSLTTGGGGTCSGGGCDRVFQPEYSVESIEQHAALMWENSYLPGVGPTPEDAPTININQKIGGILNELEKAHIYIDQLNQSIKDKDARMAAMADRLARLEALIAQQAGE